jgi:hypothetical protein
MMAGAAMPRFRVAAQSCSVYTGTPVMARTAWAVNITEPFFRSNHNL